MSSDRKAVRDLLAFYAEAGVDAPLGETANDWLAGDLPAVQASQIQASQIQASQLQDAPPQTSRPQISRPQISRPQASPPSLQRGTPPTVPEQAPPPPGAEVAIMAAREAARSAASLDELRKILDGFDGCALKGTASQLVFADGNPQARVMFVGEAPGRDEDIEGLPFVGRSGKLLDLMLAAVGLDRTKVYIANIVPWRPPGNRTPTPVETQTCLPFMLRQIELVDPDILVTMGNPSTQTLLQVTDGITRTRGRWFPFNSGAREIKAMPTFHPAFLLRSPLQKRFAWRDFLAIKKALG